MNQSDQNTSNSESFSAAEDSGTNLWRLLEIVALRGKFILSFVALATVIAVVVSLLLPQWYRAEALILPPKEERFTISSAGADISEWASFTGGLNLPVMVTPSDVYVRMLGSRDAAERVIDSFDLVNVYDVKSIAEATLVVAERADFRVTPEGLIQVSFVDREPERAALIANAFVHQLDRLNQRIHSLRSGRMLKFVRKSLSEAAQELDSARMALRRFQELNRTIDLDQQTSLAISSAVTLKAELASSEVDLTLKRRALSEFHPEVAELASRVRELKLKIAELEFGTEDSSYFSLPVASAPRLQSELAALTTRVHVAERLYEGLSVRLDEARVQQKKEIPALAALDLAIAPEIRFRPQRTLIVVGTFLISSALAVLLALFFDYLVKLERRNPADYRRANFFFDTILGRSRKKS